MLGGMSTQVMAAVRLLDTRSHDYPRLLINVPCKWPWSLMGWRKEVIGWHIGDSTVEGQGDCLMTWTDKLYVLADGRLARGEGRWAHPLSHDERAMCQPDLSKLVATLATAR